MGDKGGKKDKAKTKSQLAKKHQQREAEKHPTKRPGPALQVVERP